MEYRRDLKIEIQDDIRNVKVVIRQSEEAIYRLTHETQPFQTANLIEKAELKIKEYRKTESILIQKILDIDAGLFDVQLAEERRVNKEIAQQKGLKTKQKVNNMLAKKHYTKKEMAEQRKKNVTEFKSFSNERDACISYERFLKSVARLPDNLRAKLDHMPMNHGLIFNDIWFFGKMPEKRPYDTIVLQEKKGEHFYVHYYTDTYHSIYLKTGYGRNTKEKLQSKVAQKRVKYSESIM